MRAGTEEDYGFIARFYPEIRVGGFTSVDSAVEFYGRVNALLRPDMTVLDYGAGRGRWVEGPSPYRKGLRTLKGKVARVVGADIDPAVMDNPMLDAAVVLERDARLPFDDASFDLIVADWVFEHLEEPEIIAKELKRILKPGGWICARTLNRWGYSAIASSLIPNRWHARLAGRQPHDTFPTCYRLNTKRQIARMFSRGVFRDYTYTFTREPAYIPRSAILWHLMLLWFRLSPRPLRECLLVFLQKGED